AAERGAVEPAGSLEEAVGDAEIAVVAAPVTILPRLVEEVLAAAPAATVTDVGSTKGAVCSAVHDARFIGGHPVAGAETQGAALAEHRTRVERLESALAEGDAGFLARWIGEAAGNRRDLYRDAYPVGDLQRVLVHIPDRPGVLAGITQALGAERINIEDFELS